MAMGCSDIMTFKVLSPRTLRQRSDAVFEMPIPIVPSEPVRVDVVVPFWEGDSQWVGECVESLGNQNHAEPIVHLIADGCEFPDLPSVGVEVVKYRHKRKPGQGPYRLTNALVRHGHCQTDYLAIQDADDYPYPDRLWRQVQLLRQTGAEMVSSAMDNVAYCPEMEKRQQNEPVIYPGVCYPSVPRGRCVNSTRTLTVKLFRQMNGFANLKCSGDFDFDNRVEFSRSARVLWDMEVMAHRRLLSGSLSNGVLPLGSTQRKKSVDAVFKHLESVRKCSSCAKRFGAIKTAFELEVV